MLSKCTQSLLFSNFVGSLYWMDSFFEFIDEKCLMKFRT